MRNKYEFKTNEEKQLIIEQNKGLYLIEEQYLIEGKFLIFSTIPNMVVEKVIEEQKGILARLEATLMYDSMMKDLGLEKLKEQQVELLNQLKANEVL